MTPIKNYIEGFFDGPHATPKEADSGPIFLGIKNVTDDGRLDFSEIKHVSEDDFGRWTRRVIPQEDDIVFTYEATLHRYALIPEGFRGCLGRRMALMRPDKTKVVPKFLHYYCLSAAWRAEAEGNKISGATVDRIPLTKVPEFRVRFPDLPTQQRIASILSAYDDLIENNRRRIGLLEQAARLLYREWFVHFRFPGHETAKFIDGLPEGWRRCSTDDLFILQRGFDLPVGDRKDGDVPVYGSTGIVGYHNEPKVAAPAIITGRSGSLGEVAISNLPCWPLNTALWVKELKGIPASLVYYILVNLDLVKYNGGASVPTLDRKVVHRLPAVRPTPEITDKFDTIASTSFQTVAKLRRHNLQLTRARDLLLPRLMDGRIPV